VAGSSFRSSVWVMGGLIQAAGSSRIFGAVSLLKSAWGRGPCHGTVAYGGAACGSVEGVGWDE